MGRGEWGGIEIRWVGEVVAVEGCVAIMLY